MLEIWKRATDNKKAFGALLTELSKAIDCLCHDLLTAKLHAYDLDKDSLNILQDYLSKRKQGTKVDSFYSSWEAILSGEPQGSVFEPLLFNIFMCYMFLILKATYFTGYADDNQPFLSRDNINDVMEALEEIGENLVNWMKLSTDKFHLFLNSQESNTLKIGGLHINNSLSKKLLGITFDFKLKSTKHIEDIYQKESQKLNALARLATYMGTTKKRIPMNAIFKSHLIIAHKVNRLHE